MYLIAWQRSSGDIYFINVLWNKGSEFCLCSVTVNHTASIRTQNSGVIQYFGMFDVHLSLRKYIGTAGNACFLIFLSATFSTCRDIWASEIYGVFTVDSTTFLIVVCIPIGREAAQWIRLSDQKVGGSPLLSSVHCSNILFGDKEDQSGSYLFRDLNKYQK